MSFRTAVCPHCHHRFDSKAMSRHVGSNNCKKLQVDLQASAKQWSPAPYRLARVLSEPWFRGKVKVTNNIASQGITGPVNLGSSKWWIESWFMHYYNLLRKLGANELAIMSMMYEPIFSTDNLEQRMGILEMVVFQVKKMYGHEE